MRALIRGIRVRQRAPFVWHQAQAHRVPKHNGKEGIDAEWVVFSICSLGRSFFRGEMKTDVDYSDWAHGGVPHRRREEAMMVQMIGSDRPRRARVAHANRFHDGRNAPWR